MIEETRASYSGTGPGAIADPIEPVAIKHCLDEAFDGSALRDRTNYLAYIFRRGALNCWARHFLEDGSRVTLFRPRRPADVPESEWGAFLDDVDAFLGRRFRRVEQQDRE